MLWFNPHKIWFRFAVIVKYSVRKINIGYLGYLLIVINNGDWDPRDASEDSKASAQHFKDRTQWASRGEERDRVSLTVLGLCEAVEESVSIFTVKIDIHDPLAT